MPVIDLTELATRESEQVEWKENVADIDDVVEALCAFANDLANLGGGYVVCGAKEVKDEHGFPKMMRTGLAADRLKEVEGRVLARCRGRVAPPLTPLVTELPADTIDKRVLVFTQPATTAAHTFRRDKEGAKHFVRVGRSTIEARNGVLLNLLVRKGAAEPWDRRVCASANERDLDLLALRDTLNRMSITVPDGRVEQFLTEDRSLSPFVPTLCAREPLTNILRPRNFAMLLFGRDTQRFIPGAFSLFSVYPGTDRSDRHAERYEIAGTVLEQAARLTQLLGAQVSTAFDKEDSAAPNALKYPDRALYEAMGNALAHRDYELFDPVRITAFADRIEVLSPGALPLGVDPESFRQGHAAPRWRNQTLAWFFNRLLLAQAEGQGLATIRQTMRQEGCPPPVFEPASGYVICILPAHPRHMILHDIQEGRVALARGDLAAARQYVDRAVERDPLDPHVLQVFTALQRLAQDPKPILKLVQSHLAQVLTLPSATLIDLADALLLGITDDQSCRDLAVQLIRRAAERAPPVHELQRAQELLVQAKDAEGFLALVGQEQRRLPDRETRINTLWFGGQKLLALARRAREQQNGGDSEFLAMLSLHLFRLALAEADVPATAEAIRRDLASAEQLNATQTK